MKEYTANPEYGTIGFDLGDKAGHICEMDASGEVVFEGRLPMKATAIQKYFGAHTKVRVVLEAGTHSQWVTKLLQGLGHEVIVANPRKLRMIFQNTNKNDRMDAETLARLGRYDPKLLYPIKHRPEDIQKVRKVLKSRDALVSARSRLISHVRGNVKSLGERISGCSADAFVRRAREQLSDELIQLYAIMLKTIEDLTTRIKEYDREIKELNAQLPVTELLRTIDGVGPITALAFVATIHDPTRFARSRDIGAYLGLTPRQFQSGEKNPQLHITKAGDRYLRRILIMVAQYIIGPFGKDCDLRRYGLKRIEQGGKGTKKKVVVAVARRLSVIMLHLWLTGEQYNPFYLAEQKEAA